MIKESVIGKYCVVRCDRSGVFAGFVADMDGQTVELRDARKLWYWDGACAVEQIAVDGVEKPNKCKFTVAVSSLVVTDAIQIIPATEKAEKIIKEVREWKV